MTKAIFMTPYNLGILISLRLQKQLSDIADCTSFGSGRICYLHLNKNKNKTAASGHFISFFLRFLKEMEMTEMEIPV